MGALWAKSLKIDQFLTPTDQNSSMDRPISNTSAGRAPRQGSTSPACALAILAMRSRGSADRKAMRPALLQQVDQQMDRPLLGRPTRPQRGRRNAMPYMPSANSTKIDQ